MPSRPCRVRATSSRRLAATAAHLTFSPLRMPSISVPLACMPRRPCRVHAASCVCHACVHTTAGAAGAPALLVGGRLPLWVMSPPLTQWCAPSPLPPQARLAHLLFWSDVVYRRTDRKNMGASFRTLLSAKGLDVMHARGLIGAPHALDYALRSERMPWRMGEEEDPSTRRSAAHWHCAGRLDYSQIAHDTTRRAGAASAERRTAPPPPPPRPNLPLARAPSRPTQRCRSHAHSRAQPVCGACVGIPDAHEHATLRAAELPPARWYLMVIQWVMAGFSHGKRRGLLTGDGGFEAVVLGKVRRWRSHARVVRAPAGRGAMRASSEHPPARARGSLRILQCIRRPQAMPCIQAS